MKKKTEFVYLVGRCNIEIASHFQEVLGVFFTETEAQAYRQRLFDEGYRNVTHVRTYFAGAPK